MDHIKQVMESIKDTIDYPVCDHLLYEVTARTLSNWTELVSSGTMPGSDKMLGALMKKLSDEFASKKYCDDSACLVCTVAKVTDKHGPAVLNKFWRESMAWVYTVLSKLKDKEDTSDDVKQLSTRAVSAISWLLAQSRVAEDLINEIKELRKDNLQLRATIDILSEENLKSLRESN